MDAAREDLAGLLTLQQTDLDILRLKKQFDELPQREQIIDTRTKRAAVQEKLEKVEELKKDAAKRLTRINDEDASLAKKEAGVQAAINAAHGDYRHVTARTKELAGISKRRETIAADRDEVAAELAKINALEDKVRVAITELDSNESTLVGSFRAQGGELQAKISELEAKHAEVESSMTPEVVSAYEKTAARCGGVAVGLLADNRCGVCRTVIDGGRLIDLKAQAPIGVCPACKRMLIIDAS